MCVLSTSSLVVPASPGKDDYTTCFRHSLHSAPSLLLSTLYDRLNIASIETRFLGPDSMTSPPDPTAKTKRRQTPGREIHPNTSRSTVLPYFSQPRVRAFLFTCSPLTFQHISYSFSPRPASAVNIPLQPISICEWSLLAPRRADVRRVSFL